MFKVMPSFLVDDSCFEFFNQIEQDGDTYKFSPKNYQSLNQQVSRKEKYYCFLS